MNPDWQPLTGVYEPSGIVQLADGRFLVVEDERQHALSLVTIDPGGSVTVKPLRAGWLDFDADFWKLDDLEGVTLDAQGRVLAITSHSRNDTGEVKQSRSRLVRFAVDGNDITDRRVCTTLRATLAAAHPQLAGAANESRAKTDAGFNIEALEFDPASGGLLVGFRSPVVGGRALIATINNPAQLFDTTPAIDPELITLDLDGHGLRGIGHIPALAGHLLISGPSDRADRAFRLWFWRGPGTTAVQPVQIDGLTGLAHAEGICSASLAGRPCVVIVSDDGDRAAGRAARFATIALDRLRIGPVCE